MTTPTNPSPIRGMAVLAAVAVAVVAIAGVLVFYRRDGGVQRGESTSTSQARSPRPPVMDKDGRFLWLLDAQGLELSKASDVAIDDARRVCARLEGGESEEQVVRDIVAGSPDLSVDDATAFADIAIDVYCP